MQANKDYDDFKVGDEVWDVFFGKGRVVNIDTSSQYPVEVKYINGDKDTFTRDGKRYLTHPRSLFFSEPKIEGDVRRPFVSTLVGKTVVVETQGRDSWKDVCYVHSETADRIYTSAGGDFYLKEELKAVYELGIENLLKKG